MSEEACREAWRAARAAAERYGVLIRELAEIADLMRVQALFDAIWRPAPGNPPMTVELMRTLAHAGGYVAGAFHADRLVGASVALLAAPVGEVLHSHVTGSLRRGAGFALKAHQRAWALERGLDRITWTYDPLVRRNAYFNLVKLGALPERYLPDFYGAMGDEINAGDESDRLLAVWRLAEPRVGGAVRGVPYRPRVPAGAVAGLAERDGRPVRGRLDARVVLVAIPPDVERLRREDPATALAWRHAVRDVLGSMLGEGARVTGLDPAGRYIVERA